MKYVLPLVACLLFPSCMLRAKIGTSSRTLREFSPKAGGGTVAVIMPDDLSKFKSSNSGRDEVRDYAEEALQKRGWAVTRSIRKADYGLLFVDLDRGREVSAFLVTADAIYVGHADDSLSARLVRITKAGGPGEKVWEGFANGSNYSDMAYKVILEEFPRRDE